MSLKYLVLNGNPYRNRKGMDQYIDRLLAGIKSAGHEVQALVLRDMKIKPCTGCFSCWVKNPGNCIIQDDGNEVARQYIASDHVILASPLIMGFLSSLMKNTMDRNIPLATRILRRWMAKYIIRSATTNTRSFHSCWRRNPSPMLRILPSQQKFSGEKPST